MPLPLEGIRVLDLATMLAGPYGATMLGDMGADVIKIEPPRGDESRTLGPGIENDSGMYVGINRNKRSLVLDLTKPEGREVYYRLVKTADIVIENLRADAEQKLGVSYEDTVKHNPKIIYISVSTFGESGPYAGRPGIDPLAQALTGFMATTGVPGGPPIKTGVAVADATCSNLVAYAAMVALYTRQTQGIGQRIEMCLIDGLMHLQPVQVGQLSVSNYVTPRVGNSSPYYGPYNTFTTKDGKDIIIAPFNDKWFRNLCRAIDRPDLAADERYATNAGRMRHINELEAEIAKWFAQTNWKDAMKALIDADMIAAPVHATPDAFEDPQINHNNMLIEVEHARLGKLKVGGVAPKLSKTPGSVRKAPPVLGQHTEEILRESGFTEEEVANLRQKAVITPAENPPKALDINNMPSRF
ncbi:MAG TPA: CoA transferase [Dehalococcoidia bacterium]|nr:CoA transferase [Dehalococcoidia bacterium]